MNILWIWEIVLDKTYFTWENIIKWQKTQSNDSIISIWWPVPSALKLLRNLGCDVTMVWVAWWWVMSNYVRKLFDSYFINHFLVCDTATKLNTIIVDEKTWTRTIIKDKFHNELLFEVPLDLLKKADLVIFDRTEKKVFDFVLKNKNPDTKIIVDPSSEFNQEIVYMMKNSDVHIFPIETLYKVSDNYNFEENLKKLYELLWKNIIITDWWNGTYFYNWGDIENYKAMNINPIDTNWAWDVYRWAFAWGLLQNWDLKACINFANRVAWLQCLKKWNLVAVPSKEEIEKYFSF